MRWRNNRRSERVLRPKVAALPKEALQKLHERTVKFVEKSPLLRTLVASAQLSRGRLYLWAAPDVLMARITPLSAESMLLETPHRNSWVEHRRSTLSSVLKYVEADRDGTFHGLGSILGKGGKRSVQAVLYQDFGIPIPVLAEPREWYSKHRKPKIVETSDANDRILVRFFAEAMSGTFHGTCLYAFRDEAWNCYTIKPSASTTIGDAEAWLQKRAWRDW